MEIGPQIPSHLLVPASNESDEEEYGPPLPPSPPEAVQNATIPPHMGGPQPRKPPRTGPSSPPRRSPAFQDEEENEEEEEDAYTPALPPDLVARPTQTPRPAPPNRVLGPALPGPATRLNDESDDEVGPMPAATTADAESSEDVVREFVAREKRRAAAAEAANAPKKLVREEWMLVPPSSSGVLGSLDPTKLKARQFSRSARPDVKTQDNSLWTETPAERQARIKDEVHGKRKRATEVDFADTDAHEYDGHKRRRHDDAIAAQVAEYNRETRSQSLVDMHKSSSKNNAEKDVGIWDHTRDMSVGGRLMDERQRSKMINDARGLGDRFGKGKSGGWL